MPKPQASPPAADCSPLSPDAKVWANRVRSNQRRRKQKLCRLRLRRR